jgi:hypothetical protein
VTNFQTVVIEHKDVVLALLGASAGLAGLVLVFLGFIISTMASFDPTAGAAVLAPYRRTAAVATGAFGMSIVTVAIATWWVVLLRDNEALYVTTVGLFFAQLVVLSAAAAIALRQLVWAS